MPCQDVVECAATPFQAHPENSIPCAVLQPRHKQAPDQHLGRIGAAAPVASCLFTLLRALAQTLKVLCISSSCDRGLQAPEHHRAELATVFVTPDEFAHILT